MEIEIDKAKNLMTTAAKLRTQAEEHLQKNRAAHLKLRSSDDNLRLVHELEVHQIELEMQNHELSRVHGELEVLLNTYADLYDFAPVGYYTFDAGGAIKRVNHAGAQQVGMDRITLLNRPFSGFINDSAERKVFSDHLTLVLQQRSMQKCAISITRSDGEQIHCQLQSNALHSTIAGLVLTSIIDVTIRKQYEESLQTEKDRMELLVRERTAELSSSNMQLTQEIDERKRADSSLQSAFAEIKVLKDRLQEENIYLQQNVDRQFNFGEIIGQSTVLSHVFTQIEQVAPMNATVLMLGETGTGKGFVARAIHSRSARKGRPLITVDCTTLPASLVESELFGRERGAFTGSDARQVGRFELADGGTIFLDEIGEMPLELQSKLLRIIQDGEFERLGSPRTIKTDVRIIAATNRNLAEEVKNGKFREDLYYRLNVFPITMPPLRQRKEDIPLLVNHFVAKFNTKIGKKIESVSKDTLNYLQGYHWPGNVRELESVIERAVIITRGTSLQVLDRFDTFNIMEEVAGEDIKALVELEHDHVLQVLLKTNWRIEEKKGAALILGLNPSTLRARMRKYGISRH